MAPHTHDPPPSVCASSSQRPCLEGVLDLSEARDIISQRPLTAMIVSSEDVFPLSIAVGAAEASAELGVRVVYNSTYPLSLTTAQLQENVLAAIQAAKSRNGGLLPDIFIGGGIVSDAQAITRVVRRNRLQFGAIMLTIGPVVPEFQQAMDAAGDGWMTDGACGSVVSVIDQFVAEHVCAVDQFVTEPVSALCLPHPHPTYLSIPLSPHQVCSARPTGIVHFRCTTTCLAARRTGHSCGRPNTDELRRIRPRPGRRRCWC